MEEMGPYLEEDEVKSIALSIKTITYELCIRFLTDYINGDTYFKIRYKEHNRDRFLNQFTLLQDIETKTEEIDEYIDELYSNHHKGNAQVKKIGPINKTTH